MADFLLRENGHSVEETGLVYTFERIGVGGEKPIDSRSLDRATLQGVGRAHRDALELIRASKDQISTKKVHNWRLADIGMYVYNRRHSMQIN